MVPLSSPMSGMECSHNSRLREAFQPVLKDSAACSQYMDFRDQCIPSITPQESLTCPVPSRMYCKEKKSWSGLSAMAELQGALQELYNSKVIENGSPSCCGWSTGIVHLPGFSLCTGKPAIDFLTAF